MKLISKAIIKVTQSVKTLEKNATVGFGRNSYDGTKMFDVMIAFNQIMSDNGLSILTTDVQDDVRVERWEENGRTRQSIFCSRSRQSRQGIRKGIHIRIEKLSYQHVPDSGRKGRRHRRGTFRQYSCSTKKQSKEIAVTTTGKIF